MNALSRLLLRLPLYLAFSRNHPNKNHVSLIKWCSIAFVGILTMACSDSSGVSDKTPYTKSDIETFILDNGLNVILWNNGDKDADFKLLIKSGSLQEEEDQLGYAHFVEHMVFNQTTPNGSNPVHNSLEKLGLRLGRHANAFTYFSHTDYHLYIEENDPEKTQIALDLLANFATNTHFDEAEVEKEKPVIIEEWRLKDTDQKSVASQMIHSKIKNSRYAERFPIGSYESINNATAESLNRYYQRHYRADNATLIVTGNVNHNAIKESVVALFGPWKSLNKSTTNVFALPNLDNEGAAIYSDESMGKYVLTRSHTFETSPYLTEEDEVETNKLTAILDILNDRIKHRLVDTQGNVESIKAYLATEELGRIVLSFSAATNYDGISQAAIILTEEMARLAKYGLLEKEWQHWTEEQATKIKERFDSPHYLSFIASRHVLNNELMLSKSDYIKLMETARAETSLTDLQSIASTFFQLPFYTTLAHKAGQPAPTKNTLVNYFDHNTDHIVPNVALLDEQEWPLVKDAGRILNKKTLSSGVMEYQLSNGMLVRFYETNSSESNVFMNLVGLGGLDEMPEQHVLAARLATSVMGASGLRDMTGPELNEWLSNEGVGLKVHFTFNSRELEMESSIEDLDVLLRLMHIAVTEVNVDPKVFTHIQQLNVDQLEQMQSNPANEFTIASESILTQNDPAFRRMTVEEVLQVDADSMSKIYQTYFQGSQNYVLTIVGGVSSDYLETLLVDYVANIPQTEAKRATPRPNPIASESTVVEGQGSGHKSTGVTIIKTIDKEVFNDSFAPAIFWLKDRVNKRLFDSIREDQGLVYSIQANLDGNHPVAKSYVLRVDFAADPVKVKSVIQAVGKVLEEVALEVPTQSELDTFLSKERKAHEEKIQEGKTLSTLLAGVDFHKVSIDTIFSVNDFIDEKDAESTQELMSAFLSENSIDTTFILNP
ncbi:M16 family metallopeptidase [Marinomonas sp. 2405UD68-3]|uniref:M16 family metallopeptidase n=1 Tax=Marinomonas sp. 2405UD68-3 TaxID=3391835 RepID=UPI0039C907E9